jgi:hypothetical protein
MDKREDGGPAFPTAYAASDGMKLRDWFAGQALAGLTARHEQYASIEEVASLAYAVADAMLAAR